MQAPGPHSQWYVGRDGQQYGPMPTTQLQGDYRAGVLLPTDYLWCAEIDRWILASEIFGSASRPPPPPPPPHPQQTLTQALPQREMAALPAHAQQLHPPAREVVGESAGQDRVTQTIVEGGSFKFSTLLWFIAGLFVPLWPISLPICWYMAYKSYKAPSTQTVRIVTERR